MRVKAENGIRYFFIIAALFSFLTYAHDLARELAFSEFDDVGHYYVCAKLLGEGYDIFKGSPQEAERAARIVQEMATTKSQYYMPLHSLNFFLLFLPFTCLSYHQAAVSWIIFTNLLFICGIFFILRYFGRLPLWKVCSAVFMAFFIWPLREEMHFGQPNILIVFLFAAGLLALKRKNDFALGVCLALGVAVKEIFAVVLLFLLWLRNWRAFLWALGTFALLKAASILVFGLHSEISYWRYQYGVWGLGFPRGTMSISFAETVRRMCGAVISEKVIARALFLVNLFLFAWLLRLVGMKNRFSGEKKAALGFCLFFLAAILTAPWLRETHLVTVVIPLLVAWLCLDGSAKTGYYILFTVVYLMIGLRYSVLSFQPFYSGPLSIFCALKTLGCLGLFYLIGKLKGEKDVL